MTNTITGHMPTDSASSQYFQTAESDLDEVPTSEYFSASWTLPLPTFTAISRQGDDWRAALRDEIVAELTDWIEIITKPAADGGGIEDEDVRFAVQIPVSADQVLGRTAIGVKKG